MPTERRCKNAAPRDRPYRLFDGGGPYLEVVRTGAKYRRLKYRYGGREKRLAIASIRR